VSSPARDGTRAGVLLLALFTAACGRFYEYPDPVPERGAALCADGIDDDLDAKIDCDDPDCVGFCPEEGAAACADQLDNDGDGLLDAADPRCWLEAAPVVTRCAAASGVELVENFDAPAWSTPHSPWARYGAGSDDQGLGIAVVEHVFHPDVLGDGRGDGLVSFSYHSPASEHPEASLGSLVRVQAFSGSLAGFSLSFAASVARGALLRAGIVPIDDAPASAAPGREAETKVLALTIDELHSPPTLSLTVAGEVSSAPFDPPACEDDAACAKQLATVTVTFESGLFTATLVDAAGAEVAVRSGTVPFSSFPVSRLVLWGGSFESGERALVDDLRLEMRPEWPCGDSEPPIASGSCASPAPERGLGHGVALARGRARDFCALVTASDDPEGAPQSISAWSSADGARWSRASGVGEPAIALPAGAVLVGAGVAADQDGWHAVVAQRTAAAVTLGFADATECGQFGMLAPGPDLFADAGAPSYVIVDGKHELYFTRPPTDETGRSLWRLELGDSEPTLLAELPPDVDEPVSVSLVGKNDLVLAYPTLAGAGRPGAGLLVADASRGHWRSTASTPLLALPNPLERQEGRVAFDDRGLRSVAFGWRGDSGFLLYAGLSANNSDPTGADAVLALGTARIDPAGKPAGETPSVPEERCGNGSCDAGEDCRSCAVDCDCAGAVLVPEPYGEAGAWERVSSEPGTGAYWAPETPELTLTGGASSWSVLPLARALTGDFEVSFDVYVGMFDNASDSEPASSWLPCSAYVGLGTPPPPGLVPSSTNELVGAFAELAFSRRCANAYFATPFVRVRERAFTAETPDAAADCRDAAYLAPSRWQHVVLRREGGRVTSEIALEGDCGTEALSVAFAGSLGALPALLVGFGGRSFEPCARGAGTATLRNLTLRLLDEPEACPAGKRACAADGEETLCADLSADPEHCGRCDQACGPNQVCQNGVCVCSDLPGLSECDTACVDTASSPDHCGGCGRRCSERCTRGECDVIFGECGEPYELSPEGGSFTLDFAQVNATVESVDCASISGSHELGPDIPLHHVLLVSWTPSRSGNAFVRVADAVEDLDTLLGFSDVSAVGACFDWTTCNDNGRSLRHGSLLSAAVAAGTTYRIGIGIYGSLTQAMKAKLEVGFE
jgi:hypothetical protein